MSIHVEQYQRPTAVYPAGAGLAQYTAQTKPADRTTPPTAIPAIAPVEREADEPVEPRDLITALVGPGVTGEPAGPGVDGNPVGSGVTGECVG